MQYLLLVCRLLEVCDQDILQCANGLDRVNLRSRLRHLQQHVSAFTDADVKKMPLAMYSKGFHAWCTSFATYTCSKSGKFLVYATEKPENAESWPWHSCSQISTALTGRRVALGVGGGGEGGGGGWAAPEPVYTPAPPTACRPPTHGPVTPPYELPAPAWLMVLPQNSGRQKPPVVSARGGLQTVCPAHGAPACACN